MNKIFCFGDGYATNHIWPEWSAIISALYPNIEVKNYSAIGAGNEFTSSSIIEAYLKSPDAFFLVQWSPAQRFDKLLEDNTWDEIIETDKTYYFNRVEMNNKLWWLSSASYQPSVQHYHKHYIQEKQAQLRTFNIIYLVTRLLLNQGLHFSTQNLNFTTDQWLTLSQVPWIKMDMSSYSNLLKFSEIRQSEIQPSPPVHMSWVEEKILPQMPVQPDKFRLNELKNRINSQKWSAYNPDRDEIWKTLINF